MNLVPSFSDRARPVVGLALQLGCTHIAMIASLENKETQITRQISIQAQHNGLSFKLHSFTSIKETASFAKTVKDLSLKTKTGFTMFVLHCKPSDAKIFIEATESLYSFQWGRQIVWLFLGDSFTETSTADNLPSGVLGIRPSFQEVDLLHDALEMINRTIQRVSINHSIGFTFDMECILNDPPQRDKRGIIR